MSDTNLGQSVIGALHSFRGSASELGREALAPSDLIAAAYELAAALRAACVVASEPVALFISNKPHDLIGFLGLWLAGCVAVPIHITTPDQAVRTLIARVGARFAVRVGKVDQIGAAPAPARALLERAALIVGFRSAPLRGDAVRPLQGAYDRDRASRRLPGGGRQRP